MLQINSYLKWNNLFNSILNLDSSILKYGFKDHQLNTHKLKLFSSQNAAKIKQNFKNNAKLHYSKSTESITISTRVITLLS